MIRPGLPLTSVQSERSNSWRARSGDPAVGSSDAPIEGDRVEAGDVLAEIRRHRAATKRPSARPSDWRPRA